MEGYYGIQKDGYYIIVLPFFNHYGEWAGKYLIRAKQMFLNVISPMKEQVIQKIPSGSNRI
jgi:hypothetical protein